ncbi:hypothetical protein [Bacillus sp. 2205SS5-2]|uniref:hypothetical protein n=1 Tax=Bacillus sp. 2205SS5-2 TaxID=3109031 RepID=UPI003004E944
MVYLNQNQRKAEAGRSAAAGKCWFTEKVLTFAVERYLSHSCYPLQLDPSVFDGNQLENGGFSQKTDDIATMYTKPHVLSDTAMNENGV